ncbi:MAG: 2-dehydropantoate 2-reductase [bacterium]|nr:2-dehydropantoate 2-reductase [bacterium]
MTSAVVMGAGALGSIFATALFDAGCDVTILSRRAHAESISESGLRLRALDGSERVVRLRATDDPLALRPAEIVMFTAKAFDIPTLVDLAPRQARCVASVQNGVGKDDLLVEQFGLSVVGCVTMTGGTLVEPGTVHHTLNGVTYIGPLPSTADGVDRELADTLAAGGLPLKIRADIDSVSWSKAVLAVAAMGVVALTRLRFHRALLNEHAAGLLYDLAVEGALVAKADGVDLVDLPGALQMKSIVSLGRHEAVARLSSIGAELVAAGATKIRLSILQGIESRRRTEVEAVHGEVLARARRHGIAVPVLETVTAAIRAVDAELL